MHVVFVFVQSVYCIVCNLLCEQKKMFLEFSNFKIVDLI